MDRERVIIRRAGMADAATLVAQRRAMFQEMGHDDDAALDEMTAAFVPWLRRHFEADDYVALLAEADGEAVAGAGVWFMDWLPHMIGAGAPRANIVNVYTVPGWRRRGLARRLMEATLDECRRRGVRAVILHASRDGRPLYESLGFGPTNEMRLVLSAAPLGDSLPLTGTAPLARS